MKYFNIIFKLLDKKEKTFFYLLLFLVLVSVLLETLSIGLVIPITSYVLNVDNYLTENFNFLKKYSSNEKFLAAIIFFFLVIVFKNIYLTIVSLFQQRYTWGVYKNVSSKFFKIYLNLDYKNITNLNSSEIIKNISVQLNLITTYINSIIFLIIEILIIIGVSLLLFLFDPISMILIFVSYGLVIFIYVFFVKNIMTKVGNNRKKYDYKILDNLNNALGAYKFIILQNLQGLFQRNHNEYVSKISEAGLNQGFISSLPKYIIETITIMIVLFIVYYYNNEYSIEQVIQLLALFVAAAFKLIPSINRIMVSISHLQASYPIINNLIDQKNKFQISDYSLNEEHKYIDSLKFTHSIKFQKVSFSYDKNLILNELNLSIEKNKFIGIMGESGVGKSTFINLLMGFIMPDEGNIIVDGTNIYKNIKSWQKKIGYVPQSIYLKDSSLLENIAYGLEIKDINKDKVQKAISSASINKYEVENVYNKIGEKGSLISGGQAQRIGIARALYTSCEIIILDEPTSSLDDRREKEVMQSITNLKSSKTIILISHKRENLLNCDYVYKIENKIFKKIEI